MKIRAKVEYLGTLFSGWQIQDKQRTVEGEIEKVLSKIHNQEIKIYGSGRTDAGVHAYGQVFHYEVDKEVDLGKLLYSLNLMLPHDIHLVSLEKASEDFHARYSVKSKHYQYVINNGSRDPFTYGRCYEFPYEINYEKLEKALLMFAGKHNYQSFTSKEEDEENFIRNISSISLKKDNKYLIIDFLGDGFMRYMIRFIVGTALAVATGKEEFDYIQNRLDQDKRDIVSYKADSDGLYLIDVIY